MNNLLIPAVVEQSAAVILMPDYGILFQSEPTTTFKMQANIK